MDIGCGNGDTEYIRQCIRLYEETLELASQEGKNVVQVMLNLGSAYYYWHI